MKKIIPITLVVAASAFCLMGCQNEQPAATATPAAGTAPAATTNAAPAGAPAGPAPSLPAGASDQMTKALNDPNTPPAVKEQIRQQMGGK
jgi:hypothetical protein